MKRRIILEIGIADGMGDWVHGLEIARFLKKEYPNHDIIGLCYFYKQEGSRKVTIEGLFERYSDGAPFDAVSAFGAIEWKGARAHRFFDIKNWESASNYGPFYEPETFEAIEKAYGDKSNIEQVFSVSFAPGTLALQETKLLQYRDSEEEKREIPRFSLDEYSYFDSGMGLGDKKYGIRLPLEVDQLEAESFLAKVKEDVPVFYRALMHHSAIKEKATDQVDFFAKEPSIFLSERKLLPCDLRREDSIILFINSYLQRYGKKCDFYLPASRMANPQFKQKVAAVFDGSVIPVTLINPESRLDEDSEVSDARIFYNFLDGPEHDEIYKGLYRYNLHAGAGVGGDDGLTQAIRGEQLFLFDSGNNSTKMSIYSQLKKCAQRHKCYELAKCFDLMWKNPGFLPSIFANELLIQSIESECQKLCQILKRHPQYSIYHNIKKIMKKAMDTRRLHSISNKVFELMDEISLPDLAPEAKVLLTERLEKEKLQMKQLLAAIKDKASQPSRLGNEFGVSLEASQIEKTKLECFIEQVEKTEQAELIASAASIAAGLKIAVSESKEASSTASETAAPTKAASIVSAGSEATSTTLEEGASEEEVLKMKKETGPTSS
jgi:hypothetical protein